MASDGGKARAAHDRTLFLTGIDLFNRSAFFESHERWEDLWLRNRSPVRSFLQGLIQLAAAFYHLERRRHAAMVRLLDVSMERLSPFAPRTLGLDVGSLLPLLAKARARAAALGPDGLDLFERALIPRLSHEPPTAEAFWPHRGTHGGPAGKHDWYWQEGDG